MATLTKMVARVIERTRGTLRQGDCPAEIANIDMCLLTVEEQGKHGTKAPQDKLRAEVIGWLMHLGGSDIDLSMYHLQIGRSRSSSQCKFVGVAAVQCPKHNRKAVELRVRPEDHVYYWTCSLITQSDQEALTLLHLARPKEMGVVSEAMKAMQHRALDIESNNGREQRRKADAMLCETKSVIPLQKSLADNATKRLLCSHLLAMIQEPDHVIPKGKIRRALSKTLGRIEISVWEHKHAIILLLEDGILDIGKGDDQYEPTIACYELGEDHDTCRQDNAREELRSELLKIKRQLDEAARSFEEIERRRNELIQWKDELERTKALKEADLAILSVNAEQ